MFLNKHCKDFTSFPTVFYCMPCIQCIHDKYFSFQHRIFMKNQLSCFCKSNGRAFLERERVGEIGCWHVRKITATLDDRQGPLPLLRSSQGHKGKPHKRTSFRMANGCAQCPTGAVVSVAAGSWWVRGSVRYRCVAHATTLHWMDGRWCITTEDRPFKGLADVAVRQRYYSVGGSDRLPCTRAAPVVLSNTVCWVFAKINK